MTTTNKLKDVNTKDLPLARMSHAEVRALWGAQRREYFRRLIEVGWTPARIAAYAGITRQAVSQMLSEE